jgi:hypothetical protein
MPNPIAATANPKAIDFLAADVRPALRILGVMSRSGRGLEGRARTDCLISTFARSALDLQAGRDRRDRLLGGRRVLVRDNPPIA